MQTPVFFLRRALCRALQLTMLALYCGLTACDTQRGTAPGGVPLGGRTIGMVLSGYDHLFYATKDGKEECPDGFVHSSKENWYAQFPNRATRKAHLDSCAGVDNRGPNCANVLIAPEAVKDVLPYRQVKGAKSYGVNLDGTEDGQETASTCAHEQFVRPDGTKGIDNQYYRLLGCQKIVQSGGRFAPGAAEVTIKQFISGSRSQRTLLELRNVDSERSDEHVIVAVYRGKDPLAVDAEGNATPWQTQRVDDGKVPQYLRGRIVNGELITEPTDVYMNAVAFYTRSSILVRGAQLRLRLTASGARGLRTGYVDAESWWQARRTSLLAGSLSGDSPPALYEAMNRLADGYKNTKTGVCTALSSATKLEFVRAYIRHPNKRDMQ